MPDEVLVVSATETLVVTDVAAEVLDASGTQELLEVASQGPAGPQGQQGVQGIQGPKGDTGAKGDPGPAGGVSYVHTQAIPASVWTIDHFMGKHPALVVTDSAGSMVEGEVEYPSLDRTVVTFAAAFSGVAHLN